MNCSETQGRPPQGVGNAATFREEVAVANPSLGRVTNSFQLRLFSSKALSGKTGAGGGGGAVSAREKRTCLAPTPRRFSGAPPLLLWGFVPHLPTCTPFPPRQVHVPG